MTTRDRKDIKRLHFVNNYTKATLSRLFGLCRSRMTAIINEELTIFNTGFACVLCSNEDEVECYYIDGNEKNNTPQNKIMLCEPDRRRIRALQRRRHAAVLKRQD